MEDIYNGAIKPVEIKRRRICKTCKGKGSPKPNAIKKCRGCDGMGVKIVTRQIPAGIIQQQVQCPDCRGEGSTINESDKCGDCRGTAVKLESKSLQVEINKGVKDGKKIVFENESDEIPNVKPGDAIVELVVEKHSHFIRKGADLYFNSKITLLEALVGFEVEIPHFNGKKILIKSRPGEIISPGMIILI